MFVAGDNNTYKVIQECANEDGSQKWFLLECVDFYAEDDIGDQNYVSEIGDTRWGADYFFRNMPVL